MKDRLFYPIAALVIAGIITLALSLGEDTPSLTKAQILDRGFVVTGESLSFLTPSPGTILESRPTSIVLKSHLTRDVAPPSAGIFATLGKNFEEAFAGQKIDIQVRARSLGKDVATVLDVGYFTVGAGDSGWNSFVLTEEFKSYGFTFTPQASIGGLEQDFVGLWPDPSGSDIGIEVESISVKAALAQ